MKQKPAITFTGRGVIRIRNATPEAMGDGALVNLAFCLENWKRDARILNDEGKRFLDWAIAFWTNQARENGRIGSATKLFEAYRRKAAK